MKTLIEENDLMSIEDAARYIGVTPKTFIVNYSNKLNDVKHKIGKKCYFPKESLKRFLIINKN